MRPETQQETRGAFARVEEVSSLDHLKRDELKWTIPAETVKKTTSSIFQTTQDKSFEPSKAQEKENPEKKMVFRRKSHDREISVAMAAYGRN